MCLVAALFRQSSSKTSSSALSSLRCSLTPSPMNFSFSFCYHEDQFSFSFLHFYLLICHGSRWGFGTWRVRTSRKVDLPKTVPYFSFRALVTTFNILCGLFYLIFIKIFYLSPTIISILQMQHLMHREPGNSRSARRGQNWAKFIL